MTAILFQDKPRAAQARCINYREFRYCFTWYFVREIQWKLLKRSNIGINIEINCTYVNLCLLLLFLCIKPGLNSWPFYTVLRLVACNSAVLFSCSFNSQTSPASKNRAPIHHESAKSSRPGQSLISSLVMGIMMCFLLENVLKVFGSEQSGVRSGTWPRWVRLAWWTRIRTQGIRVINITWRNVDLPTLR